MAKQTTKSEPATTDLESLAVRLDTLRTEAAEAGEERVAKSIGYAVKSARWADKTKTARLKRVGSIVLGLKAKGLTDAEIVAQLTR